MRRLSLALVAALAACGGTEPTSNPDPNPNPNPNPNPGTAVLEIGKGAAAFEALAEDEEIEIVMAPQTNGGFGIGQHVDFAVRAKGIEPQGIQVHLVLRDASETYSEVTQQLNLVADGDWWITAGFRAVLDSCGDIADKPLTVEVDVKDSAGVKVMAAKAIRGPFACPRQPG